MNKIAAAALVLGSIVSFAALADGCRHGADRTANIQGAGIRKVVVTAGAGDLVIAGEQGRDGVQTAGRACASSQELLEQIRLESRREGDTVYVTTILPDHPEGWFGERYAYLDVTVRVPKSVELSVTDSSGDLRINDVQSAVVADSSGDQSLRNIAGDLDVTDSSGELSIAQVGGSIRIKDSSGDIDVHDVRGDVVVTVDTSGDMDITKVAGSVRVVSDSSGDIEVADVQHDVTVEEDSSGSIRVRQVGGNFTVGRDGSGGIHYEQVLGSVKLPDTT